MSFDRHSVATITWDSGDVTRGELQAPGFADSSAIAKYTHLPALNLLHLETIHGDEITVQLPTPHDLAPVGGRPTIYLDQNHWSTITNTIYAPERVPDSAERAAATSLIDAALAQQVIVPMSSAHMSETCQQVEPAERYRRALTIAQLSAGWQLRDPLAVRAFELGEALALRYRQVCLLPSAVVTLAPDAVHAGTNQDLKPVPDDLPGDARWAIHVIRCAGGNLDAMLDAEHVRMNPVPGWVESFQRFSEFLGDNQTGPELKRRRTHAKFVVDLGREVAVAAHSAGITVSEMRDWSLNQSQHDVPSMGSLGFYREVAHIKLCDPSLRWEENDLIDMMYLTTAAGYCEHVVAERSHGAHLRNAARTLHRDVRIHRTLVELVASLDLFSQPSRAGRGRNSNVFSRSDP